MRVRVQISPNFERCSAAFIAFFWRGSRIAKSHTWRRHTARALRQAARARAPAARLTFEFRGPHA